MSSWSLKYGLKFHERTLPENLRSVVGLQSTAREWRRKECFDIVNDRRKTNKLTLVDTSDGNILKPDGSDSWNTGAEFGASDGGPAYATAHHADDQQETILLKFLRGAHISNLQPVSPKSTILLMLNIICIFILICCNLMQS